MAKQKVYDSLAQGIDVEVEIQPDQSRRQVVKIADSALPSGSATLAEQQAQTALLSSISAGAVYTRLVDDVGGGITYVGDAVPGSAISAPAWRIQKITDTGDISIQWAASGAFSQIWDNRTELSYS